MAILPERFFHVTIRCAAKSAANSVGHNMAKRGRKRKQHETSDGRIIPHFYKREDGRFGTSLDKNKTFGSDEREAIRRYLVWFSKRDLETVVIEVDNLIS